MGEPFSDGIGKLIVTVRPDIEGAASTGTEGAPVIIVNEGAMAERLEYPIALFATICNVVIGTLFDKSLAINIEPLISMAVYVCPAFNVYEYPVIGALRGTEAVYEMYDVPFPTEETDLIVGYVGTKYIYVTGVVGEEAIDAPASLTAFTRTL
jgi:hypothetical protein